jgi:two-component system, NarL family, sensor kinase
MQTSKLLKTKFPYRKYVMEKLVRSMNTSLKTIFAFVIIVVFGIGLFFSGWFGKVSGEVQTLEKQNATIYSWDNLLPVMYTDPDSVISIVTKRIDSIEQYGTVQEIILAYNYIASSFSIKSNYIRAMEYYDLALKKALNNDLSSTLGSLYNNIGILYCLTENYKDALDYLFRASKIMENSDANRSGIYNNIGRVYLEIGDLDKSYSYFRIAETENLRFSNTMNAPYIANHLGMYFSRKRDFDSAFYYFRMAIDLGVCQNQNFALSEIYFEKGNAYLLNNNYQEATKCYLKSDSISKILRSPAKSSFALLGMANVYLAQDNPWRALAFARQGLKIGEELESEKLKFDFLLLLSRIHEKMHQSTQALEYHKQAIYQKDKLFSQTETYKIYNIEIEHFAYQMEQKQLAMEKEQLMVIKQKNRMTFIAAMSFSFIIILSSLFYFILNKIKQAQKEKLHQTNIMLSYEKNRAAMSAEIQERKRLGMELHDGVGPLISITKLNVTTVLEDPNLSAELKTDFLLKTAHNLDEILKEMKNISHNLAPIILIEKGFEYAVKDLIAKIRNLKKHSISVNINDLNDSLESYCEHAMFRTLQEVINNIILHAQANEINIEIFRNDFEVIMMIEDNGKGFVKEETKKGLGLKSAQTRMERLGGKFYIDSKPGRGTIITIIAPAKGCIIFNPENSDILGLQETF